MAEATAADGAPAGRRPEGDRPGPLGRASEAALLLCLVIAPWPFGCAQDVWRYALAGALLVAAALWHVDGARLGRPVPPLMWAAGGAAALAGLQLALGTSVAPIWTAEAALLWLATLAALAVLLEVARGRKAATRLASVLLVVVGSQAVFGVVQASLAPGRIYGIVPSVAVSPFGSYVNHNHFAGLVEMAVPVALGWALGVWRRAGGPTPGAVALGGLGLGLIAAHLASRSRGGLAALVAALACVGLLWWARHRGARGLDRMRMAGVVTLVLALALAFGWLSVPSATRRHLATVLRGTAESAGAYRVDIAVATLRLAATRPLLGCGLGAYADAVTAFKKGHGDGRSTHAENDALQLVAEAGLLGVVLLVAVGLALVHRSLRVVRERGDPIRRGIALGAASGAVGLLVHSCLDFNLHLPANALVFVVLLSLLASSSAGLPVAARTAPPRRRAAPFVVAGLLVLGGLVAVWRAWGAWGFEWASRVPTPRERVAALGRVIDRHPYLSEALQQRARVRMQLAAGGSQAVSHLARARVDLEAALWLRPRWGEAWADRAWVFWAAGDLEAARSALREALALDPNNRTIQALDAQLRSVEVHRPAGRP